MPRGAGEWGALWVERLDEAAIASIDAVAQGPSRRFEQREACR